MEISSASSAAQATEIQQALSLKKAINLEQRQVLDLIESAVAPSSAPSLDPVKVGQLLDTKA
jgi:hypothetical protein